MARKPVPHEEDRDLWRIVWMADPFMLNRIELILTKGRDFFPDSSNSAILEAQLKGLVSQAPLRSLKNMGELIAPAQAAIEQLYSMRDKGQMGASNGLGSDPPHRGEHPPERHRGGHERQRGVA